MLRTRWNTKHKAIAEKKVHLQYQMAEEADGEFKEWLSNFLEPKAKEGTQWKDQESKVLKQLHENTLWDVEPELEYFFGHKINGYNVDDVQSLVSPIVSRWKKSMLQQSEAKLQADPSGQVFGPDYFHAQQVPAAPGLYLGSRLAAQDYFWLKSQHITHILTAAANFPPLFHGKFTYRILEVWDAEYQSVSEHFEAVTAWMHEALQKGGKILVHCHAGISRSGTFVCAYMIKYCQMSVEECLENIHVVRPFVQPNPGFIRQLQYFQQFCARKQPSLTPAKKDANLEPQQLVSLK